MNLTDVDDKTIRGAIAKGVTLDQYTAPFKQAFFDDLRTLQIEPAENYPAATNYIPQMIAMVQKLLDQQVAYRGGDGSIYFAIKKFANYGCLSHLHLDELQAGASERVNSDEYDKENVSDFVLWKHYDPARDGQIFWESPFGRGRPGWHLECSAMAMDLLGKTIDIHVGGVDNIFPHHENEIAQSEACSGAPFSKLWMHSEHLVVDNKKMSKSLGNFYTLRDLLKRGFTGLQVRYLLLSTHYKTKLNFTFQGLEAARHSLQRLYDFIGRLSSVQATQRQVETSKAEGLLAIASEKFLMALADDLNISAALAAIFDLVREVNALIDTQALGGIDATQVIDCLKQWNNVLGVLSFDQQVEVPAEIAKAVQERSQARKDKNWKRADELRAFVESRGFVIEDSAQGSIAKPV
jgi:cysteinyl-tRNA synthetase